MAVPAGILPIYLRSAMVEQYGLIDENKVPVVFKKIPKQLILDDIQRQGVYNDFSEMKAKIQAIPLEELLFLHDPDGKYEGANFLIASNDDIYQEKMREAEAIEARLRAEAEARAEVERLRLEEEAKLLIYVAHDYTARPWVPQGGSEEEIAAFAVRKNRPLLVHRIARRRRDFGITVEYADHEAVDKTVDLRKQIVNNYDTRRVELDVGLQAMPLRVDSGTQCAWRRSVNKASQSESVRLSEAASHQILHSNALSSFLLRALPQCNEALQQNETLNLLRNEFAIFESDDLTIGNKAENNIKDLHTLSDMQFSKFCDITCIDWLPNSTSAVGVACASKLTFDQRVEQSGKVARSHILLWTLADLMAPQMVLEAPSDILCFRFNPHRPDIVVAGLINGQIAVWDLTEMRALVRARDASKGGKDKDKGKAAGGSANADAAAKAEGSASAPSASSSSSTEAPTSGAALAAAAEEAAERASLTSKPIQPLLLSNIEKGHPRACSDLEWLPRATEVDRRGVISASDAAYSSQLVSIAPDGKVMFWDLRNALHEKKGTAAFNGLAIGSAAAIATAAAAAANASAMAELARQQVEEKGGSLAAQQAAAEQAVQANSKDEEEAKNPKWMPFFQVGLVRPTDNQDMSPVRIAIGDTSSFLVATEEGELVFCDWGSAKKADDDEAAGPRKAVKQFIKGHYATPVALQRSPHFADMFLTVGDWSFHIWKTGIDVPIFSSPFADENVLSGCWSPTRPAVIAIALADGSVQIWDLVDQSHRPIAVQSVSSNAISSLRFCQPTHALQYLAAGDAQGDLHILDIPRALRRKFAAEEELMQRFYQRELDRLAYYRALPTLPQPPSAGGSGSGKGPAALSAEDLRAREEEARAAEIAADEKAEADYQKQLQRFKQELGMAKEAKEE